MIVRLPVGYVVFFAEGTAIKTGELNDRFHLFESCEWKSKLEVEAAGFRN